MALHWRTILSMILLAAESVLLHKFSELVSRHCAICYREQEQQLGCVLCSDKTQDIHPIPVTW